MKVLILHAVHGFGGAECSLLDILKYVADKSNYILAIPPEQPLLEKAKKTGVEICVMNFPRLSKAGIVYRLPELLLRMCMAAFRLRKFCKSRGISSVYCNTHLSLFYLPRLLFRKFNVTCSCRDNVKTWGERMILQTNSTLILAVSRHILGQLSFEHAMLLYNAIDPSWAKLHHMQHRHPELCIANVGNMVSWKNQLDYIILAERIMERFPSARFFLIGAVVDRTYYGSLLEEINRRGLEAKMILTGFVDEPVQLYDKMDIVVHTALNEPFGRVVAEFMQLGKPVVAYRSGGPAEIITDRETGFLVDPGDLNTLETRTLELANDQELRIRMGRQAASHIRSAYNMSNYIQRFENLIAGNVSL